VLVSVLLAVGGKAAETEIFGGVFDGDEATLHQSVQSRGWDMQLTQIADPHPPAACCQFGHDGELVLIQLWQPQTAWLPLSFVLRTLGRRP
jgi:hypothetical protein